MADAQSFTGQTVSRYRIEGALMVSHKDRVKAGRKGNRNQQHEAKVKGGRIRFELYGNPGTSEGRAKGGRMGSREDKIKASLKGKHVRWHVKRGLKNRNCKYCNAES